MKVSARRREGRLHLREHDSPEGPKVTRTVELAASPAPSVRRGRLPEQEGAKKGETLDPERFHGVVLRLPNLHVLRGDEVDHAWGSIAVEPAKTYFLNTTVQPGEAVTGQECETAAGS